MKSTKPFPGRDLRKNKQLTKTNTCLLNVKVIQAHQLAAAQNFSAIPHSTNQLNVYLQSFTVHYRSKLAEALSFPDHP